MLNLPNTTASSQHTAMDEILGQALYDLWGARYLESTPAPPDPSLTIYRGSDHQLPQAPTNPT